MDLTQAELNANDKSSACVSRVSNTRNNIILKS